MFVSSDLLQPCNSLHDPRRQFRLSSVMKFISTAAGRISLSSTSELSCVPVWFLVVVAAILLLSSTALCNETKPPIQVVVLSFIEKDTPGYIQFAVEFRSTLERELSAPVRIYEETFDQDWLGQDPQYERTMFNTLQKKYGDRDLIVAAGNYPLQAIMQRSGAFLPNAKRVIAVGAIILTLAVLVVYLLLEMRRRNSSERSLKSSLQFENAISQLLAHFINLPADSIDSEIAHALCQLAALLKIDRVSMLEFTPDNAELLLTDSTTGTAGSTSRFKAEQLSWYSTKLLNNEMVFIADVDQLPEEAQGLMNVLKSRGIASTISLPLVASGSVLGALSFSSTHKGMVWGKAAAGQARFLGQIFASALLRKRSERSLTSSEHLKASILASLDNHLAVLNQEGIILAIKDHWFESSPENHVGRRSAGIGDNYLDVFERAWGTNTIETAAAVRGIRAVCDGERDHFDMEYSCEFGDEQHWFVMTVKPLKDSSGGVVITHRNTSTERRAEQAIRDLSGRLIRAQEEERLRIARELHDDINQQLALLAIELRRTRSSSTPLPQLQFEGICKKVDDISEDVHRLAHRLHSAKLEHLGLATALRSMCDEFSKQQKIRVNCRFERMPAKLDAGVSLSLFRVAQEALSNVAKHSNARNVHIELIGSSHDLFLRVSDDGIGFQTDSIQGRSGLGMISMRERLRSVGGVLTVSSKPSGGTKVEAHLPLVTDSSARDGRPDSAA